MPTAESPHCHMPTAKDHLVMLAGNAILLNGATQSANREIGVPGFQPIRFVHDAR
jgi:hypothetical protein